MLHPASWAAAIRIRQLTVLQTDRGSTRLRMVHEFSLNPSTETHGRRAVEADAVETFVEDVWTSLQKHNACQMLEYHPGIFRYLDQHKGARLQYWTMVRLRFKEDPDHWKL